jgi:AcrR family transcriptional regulator
MAPENSDGNRLEERSAGGAQDGSAASDTTSTETPVTETSASETSASLDDASPHLRAPKQERSRRTLQRIVQAALQLIGERGVEETSVQDIVQRADSSVGSFYARFEGKEDLLRYLEDRLWSDAEQRWQDALQAHAWDELELDDLVETVVRLLLQAYRAGARARRVLESRKGSEGVSDAARTFHQQLRSGIRELLLAHAEDMSHPDPELAVDLGLAVIVGAIREFEESADLTPVLPGLEDDRRIAELARLYKAYLGTANPRDGNQMDFFDIWG